MTDYSFLFPFVLPDLFVTFITIHIQLCYFLMTASLIVLSLPDPLVSYCHARTIGILLFFMLIYISFLFTDR